MSLVIRPREFQTAGTLQEVPSTSMDASPPSESSTGDYSPSQTFYVRTADGARGVLSVAEVKTPVLQLRLCLGLSRSCVVVLQPAAEVPDARERTSGYQHLLRTEEVWPLLDRDQSYPNWFCTLNFVCTRVFGGCVWLCRSSLIASDVENLRKDNLTADLAKSWQVDFCKHLIRPTGYKGTRLELEEDLPSVRLSFNAMSFPGFFFTDAGQHKSLQLPFPRCVLEHRIFFWSRARLPPLCRSDPAALATRKPASKLSRSLWQASARRT